MRIATVIAVLLVLAVTAHANPKAEKLNSEGIAAARGKDWGKARTKFEASYELDPVPRTLFNRAQAEEHTDKLVAARKSYNLYLQRSKSGEDDTFRTIATQKLAELDGKLGTVQVKSSFGDDVVIELDGHVLDAIERATPVLVDPGEHVIVVRRGDAIVQKKSVMVSGGSRVDAELAPAQLPRPETAVKTVPDSATKIAVVAKPTPHESSVFSSPWFWAVTGVVVIGVAAGGYYEFTTHDPTHGTLGPGVLTAP